MQLHLTSSAITSSSLSKTAACTGVFCWTMEWRFCWSVILKQTNLLLQWRSMLVCCSFMGMLYFIDYYFYVNTCKRAHVWSKRTARISSFLWAYAFPWNWKVSCWKWVSTFPQWTWYQLLIIIFLKWINTSFVIFKMIYKSRWKLQCIHCIRSYKLLFWCGAAAAGASSGSLCSVLS